MTSTTGRSDLKEMAYKKEDGGRTELPGWHKVYPPVALDVVAAQGINDQTRWMEFEEKACDEEQRKTPGRSVLQRLGTVIGSDKDGSFCGCKGHKVMVRN